MDRPIGLKPAFKAQTRPAQVPMLLATIVPRKRAPKTGRNRKRPRNRGATVARGDLR